MNYADNHHLPHQPQPSCMVPHQPSTIHYPHLLSVICYLLSVICYLFLAPGCATRFPTLSPVGEFPLAADAPEGLSGIARVNSDTYALAEDSGGRIHFAQILLDKEAGTITNCTFTGILEVPGLVDAEGIAYNKYRGKEGTLYVADENGPKIVQFPLGSQRKVDKILDSVFLPFSGGAVETRPLPLPEFIRHARPNKSLEALSLDRPGSGYLPQFGLPLWTANEDALTIDGPPSSATNAALVRIFSFIPMNASEAFRGDWWFYQLDAAQGGPIPGAGKDVPFNGLVGLAALGDGKLLVLERSCGLVQGEDGGSPSLITSSIYYVDTSRTKPGSPTPLKKKLLWRQGFPFSNYEGITLGPKLADGSRAVILVADGDVSKARVAGMSVTLQWKKALFTLRLCKE